MTTPDTAPFVAAPMRGLSFAYNGRAALYKIDVEGVFAHAGTDALTISLEQIGGPSLLLQQIRDAVFEVEITEPASPRKYRLTATDEGDESAHHDFVLAVEDVRRV